ncbi:hypothetical protein HPC38_02300 [Pasteurellaceae bacterium HPA106]|uniref:hypothetical protein n=1 Tax=Spirabiliibacterium pneumoniae TaxID=221400 RepID=UPI001AAD6021|nr:hypothetical protein [Spirabiliibacterium pneumoniae]MBE2895710.1 hypothetical protein [Spirabiliibacterium pneumoniae]
MAGRRLNTQEVSSEDAYLEYGRTDTTSRSFRIGETPARIVAFGLTGNDVVNVNRVLKPSASLNRDACGHLLSMPTLFEQPHYVGRRKVKLTAEAPEVVIDASGDFILEFVGENREEAHVVLIREKVTKEIINEMRGVE